MSCCYIMWKGTLSEEANGVFIDNNEQMQIMALAILMGSCKESHRGVKHEASITQAGDAKSKECTSMANEQASSLFFRFQRGDDLRTERECF